MPWTRPNVRVQEPFEACKRGRRAVLTYLLHNGIQVRQISRLRICWRERHAGYVEFLAGTSGHLGG